MSIFEHNHRARIYNPGQHPYHHTADEFAYTSSSLPSTITTLGGALDYLTAVLYPQAKPAVATVAALPAVGNTINDYRVVNDDGDGKAAGYRWEQREGEAAATWHKISDLDWGSDSILQEWEARTQDQFVMRYGYDAIDGSGVVIAGTLAGQVIYGGKAASSNLTLYPNAGDGAGAVSGFVQAASHLRPIGTTNTLDLGGSSNKWRTGYFGTSVLAGTATVSGGTYADSSGAVSFGALNLSTSGTLSAGATTGTSFIVGSTTLTARSINDSTPGATFSFNAMAVSTTGAGTFNSVSATGAVSTLKTGSAIGALTLGNGSITDGSGSISFGSTNLSTSGTLASGTHTVGNSQLSSGQLTTGSGDLTLNAASGVITVSATTLACQAVTAATSYTRGNTVLTDGSLSSGATTTLTLTTTSLLHDATTVRAKTDTTTALGDATHRYTSLFLSTGVGDGTNSIAIATLLSLRSILSGVASGYGIFYNGSQWVAADPDAEVFHNSISNLTGVGTDGDAGHSQFVVAAGRASAQTIKGGTAASASLTLDSTAHATKGKILCSSDVAPTSDAAFSVTWSGTNLGGASNRWNNVYTAGEFINLRLENLASDPVTSAQKIGRAWWNTTTGYIGVDTGSAVQRVSLLRYSTDTSWDGSTSSKAVVVSGIDATQAIWMLRDNTNDYEQMPVKITSTGATNVTITVNSPLPAGSYRLIGLQ